MLEGEQWIKLDWSETGEYFNVRGVLFHTNEEEMNEGTVKFYVNDQECPDTSGVGVNALGGVFNCNIWGNNFEARCTETCKPALSVIEIKLWRFTALTVLEGSSYIFPGNSESYEENTLEKVFGVGSYLDLLEDYDATAYMNAYRIDRGSARVAGVVYDWFQLA